MRRDADGRCLAHGRRRCDECGVEDWERILEWLAIAQAEERAANACELIVSMYGRRRRRSDWEPTMGSEWLQTEEEWTMAHPREGWGL